jgi:uncharacterized protein
MKHAERFYRDYTETPRWHSYRVKVETTDLYIKTREDHAGRARAFVQEARDILRRQIALDGSFLTSLTPVTRPPSPHRLVERMYAASESAGVGPMAAVAGAVAEYVGARLRAMSPEVVVENGGDIWLHVGEPVVLALFAGRSAFDGLHLMVRPEKTPLGIATSSGRIGPSLSFGRADAACVIAADAALADAVATGAGNLINDESDMEAAARYAMGIDGVLGVVLAYGDRLLLQGDLELAPPRRKAG